MLTLDENCFFFLFFSRSLNLHFTHLSFIYSFSSALMFMVRSAGGD